MNNKEIPVVLYTWIIYIEINVNSTVEKNIHSES